MVTCSYQGREPDRPGSRISQHLSGIQVGRESEQCFTGVMIAAYVSDDNVLVTTGEVKTPIPDITLSTTSLTVTEDSTAFYTVRLGQEPLGDVVVSVARNDGDADLSVSPSTLSFSTSNWNIAQSVTVSATDDADGTEGTARFNHTATGADYRNSTATLTATERETGLVVTTGSLSVSEGGNSRVWDFSGLRTLRTPQP